MVPKIVFLLSAPYSGATLLSILLNQHPKVSSDGETFPYIRGSQEKCSCGKSQDACHYYANIGASMKLSSSNTYDSNLFYYIPRYCKNHIISRAFEGFWLNGFFNNVRNVITSTYPPFQTNNKQFIKKHLEFINNSLHSRNASVYFDGSKSFRRAELFTENKVTYKMIHLIRDGRAFCSSFIKNKELTGSKKDFLVAAKVWDKNIKKVDILRSRFPDLDILDVKYHQLCQSPEKELRKIYSFFDLDFDPAYLQYSSQDMHILGNRMRFIYNGTINEDLAWKDRLSDDAVNFLTRTLEKNLNRFKFTH